MFLCCLLTLVALAPDENRETWSLLTRDIYVDGMLERDARLWRGRKFDGFLLELPGVSRRMLLREEENEWRIYAAPARHFKPSKSGTGVDGPVDPERSVLGVAQEVEDHQLLFHAMGRTVLVSRHLNRFGPLEEISAVYRDAPSWRVLAVEYQPDLDALDVFKSVSEPTLLKVYFATWCGDSRNHVPRLLRTLELAANPNLELQLIGVGRGFTEPAADIARDRITNVPTMMVLRNGLELGRMVERPSAGMVEGDLADILTGTYIAPSGKYDYGDLMASGSLVRRTADGALSGTEAWKLYLRRAGGYHLWSRVETHEGPVEVVLQTDAEKQPVFVEVTRDRTDYRRRTRYFMRDGKINATLRGSDTGIIRQELACPKSLTVETPSLVINGWSASTAGDSAQRLVLNDLAAFLEPCDAARVTTETLQTEIGRQTVRRIQVGAGTWWLHADFGVPLKVTTDGETAHVTDLTAFFMTARDS